jgi:hypothetical protein
MIKKVERFVDHKKVREDSKDCNPLRYESASDWVDPIWFDCLKEIFEYEKKPALFSQHLLFIDDRIKKGHYVYRKKKIKELVKTTSDIRAEVESVSDPEERHTVVFKGWYPTDTGWPNFKYKVPRKRHEILKYLEDLVVSCDCKDFLINGKYRSNCSLCCQHITATMFFLMEEAEMPKFFHTPIEKQYGFQKSNTVELATRLLAYPLKKYQYYMNILLLKDFKQQPASVSFSVHKEWQPEYGQGEVGKPVWITYTEPEQVEGIIMALLQGYKGMMESRRDPKAFREFLDRVDLRFRADLVAKFKTFLERLRGR